MAGYTKSSSHKICNTSKIVNR